MNPQTALVLVCLLGSTLSLPMQIGILASNSNEILRLNGLTLATQMQMQGNPFLQQFMLPDLGLTPMNFNPQMTGAFGPQIPQLLVPTQGNQLTPIIIPNGQQEQMGAQDPNAPMVPQQAQTPMQMVPQYNYPYGFPQQPRMQGYPYYMSPYGYPQQRNPMMMQPNRQAPVGQPQQQTLERTTQKPQLPLQAAQPKGQAEKTLPTGTQTLPTGTQTLPDTPPPDNRGDTTGPVVDEGQSNFPFLFEP